MRTLSRDADWALGVCSRGYRITLQLILDVVYCIRTCLVALHGAEFLMGSSPQLTRGAWSREDEILMSPDVNNCLDKHLVRGGSSTLEPYPRPGGLTLS